MKQLILIRYGELALKGKNRQDFEHRLMQNIRNLLQQVLPDGVALTKTYGRLFLEIPTGTEKEVEDRLRHIFGIHSFSYVEKCGYDLEEIQKTALRLVQTQLQTAGLSPFSARTFKVQTRRPLKSYPLPSMEVSRRVGGFLRAHSPLEVDVHEPDLRVWIEIRQEGVFLYSAEIMGAGGLPVGSGGKMLLLLSGGIDSPVAGWLCMKRGVKLEAVHFQSFPFTSRQAQQKAEDLAQILTRYGHEILLHVVPFAEVQTAIRQHCQESLTITIMRRMMVRIAERISGQRQALALATGDSLGQVASQTLESIQTISEAARIPILRPLITYDKQEIIAISKKIGTYETSILPYEDCCTIFTPKAPKTRPTPKMARRAEQSLNVEALIEQAVSQTERKWFIPLQTSSFQYFSQ